MRDVRWIAIVALLGACASKRDGGTGGDVDGSVGGGSDSGVPSGDGSNETGEMVYVYAHTADTLYKVDPDTLAITMVGDFKWPGVPDAMTDIAVDKNGGIVGVSFGSVYKVDPITAKCTLLSSNLQGAFNGLSFVPAAMVGQTGDDVLVGTRNDDDVVSRIDPMTGDVSTIGHMGGSYVSSGDLVAVDGFGVAQTTEYNQGDMLVKLAPVSFTATPSQAGTGYAGIWGVAFWKGKVFGFTSGGAFVLINPSTGTAQVVQTGGPQWWGAGVTTTAPIVP